MFEAANRKLERADYFLNNIKTLAEDVHGFAYITKQQEMRANLDGFFFEIISAKDFFLQGINDHYGVGLPKQKATDIAQLKKYLRCKNESKALGVVASIEQQLSDKNSWLWNINNYRNSATHRELLHLGHEVKINLTTNDKELFDKLRQKRVSLKPISERQEKQTPPGVKRVDIPRENIKTYLFKDPEDPSQGNADIEVIPYCKQSLERMRKLLEKLYSELVI